MLRSSVDRRFALAHSPRGGGTVNGLSADDLRAIAEHGYEAQQPPTTISGHKPSASSSPTLLAASIGQGNGATTVATPVQ